jgi:hypothetical protein
LAPLSMRIKPSLIFSVIVVNSRCFLPSSSIWLFIVAFCSRSFITSGSSSFRLSSSLGSSRSSLLMGPVMRFASLDASSAERMSTSTSIQHMGDTMPNIMAATEFWVQATRITVPSGESLSA